MSGQVGRSGGGRTVLLVDDQPEFLALARRLLEDSGELAVVGEARSGCEALRLADSLTPNVVVLDVQLPGMNGFEAARRLRTAQPQLQVVLTSAADDPSFESLAGTVGASGFLPKRSLSAAALIGSLGPRQ